MMFRPAQSQATDAAAFIDGITSDVYDAMDLIGAQVADAWRDRISVPVEYATGPRGGVVVIRSKPGEPPRRDSGNLYDSIQSQVEADAHLLTVEISSDVFYAAILEDGLDRPHIDVTFEEWVDPVFDAVIEAVGSG